MILRMRTVTLREPDLEGTYTVERQQDGRLLLEPVVGPSADELIARSGGRRLTSEEFEREFGDLSSDTEG